VQKIDCNCIKEVELRQMVTIKKEAYAYDIRDTCIRPRTSKFTSNGYDLDGISDATLLYSCGYG